MLLMWSSLIDWFQIKTPTCGTLLEEPSVCSSISSRRSTTTVRPASSCPVSEQEATLINMITLQSLYYSDVLWQEFIFKTASNKQEHDIMPSEGFWLQRCRRWTSRLMCSMSVSICSVFIPPVRAMDLRKPSLFFLSLLFVFLSSVSVAVSCWITCSACTHNTLMTSCGLQTGSSRVVNEWQDRRTTGPSATWRPCWSSPRSVPLPSSNHQTADVSSLAASSPRCYDSDAVHKHKQEVSIPMTQTGNQYDPPQLTVTARSMRTYQVPAYSHTGPNQKLGWAVNHSVSDQKITGSLE